MGLTNVVDLELPEAAYTTGKSPSHARVENLHDCYRGVSRGDVLALLSAGGMLRERVNGGRVQRMIPTQDAVDAGLVFRCSGVALWGGGCGGSVGAQERGYQPCARVGESARETAGGGQ